MKRFQGFILMMGLLAFLTIPAASQSYDNSPDSHIVIPECIWAAASGGGTWVTEVQITDMTGGGTVVGAYFYYGTELQYRAVANLWTSPGVFHSVKFSNVLSSIQSLDPSFTYNGRVGALWLYTQDASHRIQAQARTINGSYGKTFPGLRLADSNTANLGRKMMIMNLTQNASYRTFVGFFNSTAGGFSMTVQFIIVDQDDHTIGSAFTKTFEPWQFMSFNPFVEAGAGSGTFDNCWLYINPTASGNFGAGTLGLYGFGSSANNNTNDSAAHIAGQFQ